MLTASLYHAHNQCSVIKKCYLFIYEATVIYCPALMEKRTMVYLLEQLQLFWLRKSHNTFAEGVPGF